MKGFFMFFGLALCTLLSGCSQPTSRSSVDAVPLIPREVLFGNPEKANPKISQNGKHLAYLASVDGVMNVWVKTIGKNDAQTVSRDNDRGIWMYWWTYNDKYLLYAQDRGGDENWHIYRVNITTNETVDLTPFEGVKASVCDTNKKYPNTVLITMNKENSKLFDVYRLALETGKIELLEKNPGNVACWIADDDLVVRAAKTFNADAGASLIFRVSEKDEWKK